MYALIDTTTGAILEYPYSITTLIRSRKDVCWPREISDALAAEYGVVLVADVAEPNAADATEVVVELPPVMIDGELRREFLKRTLTPDEFDARKQERARDKRDRRDRLLAESDWTQLLDAPPATQTAWAAYRVLLRDITKQAGWPFDVTWPTKP